MFVGWLNFGLFDMVAFVNVDIETKVETVDSAFSMVFLYLVQSLGFDLELRLYRLLLFSGSPWFSLLAGSLSGRYVLEITYSVLSFLISRAEEYVLDFYTANSRISNIWLHVKDD